MSFDALEKAALLEQYMPQVERIAKQIGARLTANVELDDLIQVGMIGLMDALQRYEHGESSFEAYAYHRIKGSIYDDLREKDHLPRSVRQMRKQFDRTRQQLSHALGRHPTDQEMASALGIEPDEFRMAQGQFELSNPLSLDECTSKDDSNLATDTGFLDRVTQNQISVEQDYVERERKEAMLHMIESLPDREQMVLRLYFEQEMTFREIGGMMGVNESRVYQIHNSAVNNLKTLIGIGV